MDIQMFHRYNNLVAENKCKPLLCHTCDNWLITRVTQDNEPALQCVYCNTFIQPGLSLYQDISAVVREHTE